MSFIKNLQLNIYKVTNYLFANWTPEGPIAVGDYGAISGFRFIKDGNISLRNIDFDLDTNRVKSAEFEYINEASIQIKAIGQAEVKGDELVPDTKAEVRIKFGKEGAFVYHLTDLTNIRFNDRQKIFQNIGRIILSGSLNWRDEYVLIDEVKQAGSSTIFVSDSANAELELQCDGDTSKKGFLAKAEANIEIAKDNSRVIKWVAAENITPLFRPVKFSFSPVGDPAPGGLPLRKVLQIIKSWFTDSLPMPININLREYIDTGDKISGDFQFTNGKMIKMVQEYEDIEGFLSRNINEETNMEATQIEEVVIKREKKMTMSR